jgi:hypothetical protein
MFDKKIVCCILVIGGKKSEIQFAPWAANVDVLIFVCGEMGNPDQTPENIVFLEDT